VSADWQGYLDRTNALGLFFLGLVGAIAVTLIVIEAGGVIARFFRAHRPEPAVCGHCDGPLPRKPLYIADQQYWGQGQPYCSARCIDAARERDGYHRNNPRGDA
jgi:hypothetical protein